MPDEGSKSVRTYESPLRERQTQQTRDEILDALTRLLEHRRPDEVTTKELAEAAEVSERTVYRHFPDRSALVDALVARSEVAAGSGAGFPSSSEDLKAHAVWLMHTLEAHPVEAQAEALLNADPRSYSGPTREHTGQLRETVDAMLPGLDRDQRAAVAAVLRVLASAQTWLRMREEFDLSGDASGPVVAWAIGVIVSAAQQGNPPPGEPT